MTEPPLNNRERLRRLRRDRPEWNREKNAKWKADNPDKLAAHKTVESAIRRGILTKQPCERCGAAELVHAHHDDYSRRLAVTWLCPTHHRERHRELDIEAGRLPPDHVPRRLVRRGLKVWGAVPLKGVRRNNGGKFRATISIGGREVSLGTFCTPEEAADAYNRKLVSIREKAA